MESTEKTFAVMHSFYKECLIVSVPGPVEYFAAQVKGSNSFSLVWTPPALEDRNGILTGYDISYQIGKSRKKMKGSIRAATSSDIIFIFISESLQHSYISSLKNGYM